MKHIAVFASGAGSNAQKIIAHFNGDVTKNARVTLVVCNKPEAGVVQIAADNGIETLLIDKETFFRGGAYVADLQQRNIDFIVLAGFLWKVPAALVQTYRGKIVNIHPALLPAYGGKGMYGQFVHKAVIEAKEPQSGITIHYVDEVYDNGTIIFQATCPITAEDTPDTLAQKVHALEHTHFATVIESLL